MVSHQFLKIDEQSNCDKLINEYKIENTIKEADYRWVLMNKLI